MEDWTSIQAGFYSNATSKVRSLTEIIFNSKLTKPEMESLIFIIQMEIMKRKELKQKKIIQIKEYQKPDPQPDITQDKTNNKD